MDLDCTALNKTVVDYKYKPKIYKYDIETFLYREGRVKVVRKLKDLLLRKRQNIKIQLSLQIQISRLRAEETLTITPYFNSQTYPVFSADLVNIALELPIKQILSHWDSFIHLGKSLYVAFPRYIFYD